MNSHGHKLFFVEDNPDDEALTLRAITSTGLPCEVTVSRHGGEALEALFSLALPPDLIILDFHLPGCNGLEIVRKARGWRHTRDVPIVMLSALESDKEILYCLRAGANSCVTKPTNAKDFSEYVSMIVKYWLGVDRHSGHMAPAKQFAARSRIGGTATGVSSPHPPVDPQQNRAMDLVRVGLSGVLPLAVASSN